MGKGWSEWRTIRAWAAHPGVRRGAALGAVQCHVCPAARWAGRAAQSSGGRHLALYCSWSSCSSAQSPPCSGSCLHPAHRSGGHVPPRPLSGCTQQQDPPGVPYDFLKYLQGCVYPWLTTTDVQDELQQSSTAWVFRYHKMEQNLTVTQNSFPSQNFISCFSYLQLCLLLQQLVDDNNSLCEK